MEVNPASSMCRSCMSCSSAEQQLVNRTAVKSKHDQIGGKACRLLAMLSPVPLHCVTSSQIVKSMVTACALLAAQDCGKAVETVWQQTFKSNCRACKAEQEGHSGGSCRVPPGKSGSETV